LISQRKLFVWKVFQDDPLDVNFAICGKCNLRIGLTKSKNTQSMWNHLSSAHKDVFRQLKLEEVEDPTRKKHIKTDTILKVLHIYQITNIIRQQLDFLQRIILVLLQ
jgi:hypothetical protein